MTTTSPRDPELLRQRLRRLALFGVLGHFDEVATEPWLPQLVEYEEAERARRSLERRLKNARLGAFKPIVDFEWAALRKVDRAQVEDLFTLKFVAEGGNAILLGPNGVGKTTVALNLAHQAVVRGYTVRFTTASDMLNDLAARDGDLSLARRLRRYCRPQLLCIDEVGYLSYDARYADLLFEVVTRRYNEQRAIVYIAAGRAQAVPQEGEPRNHRAPRPARLYALERELARRRPGYRAPRSRPVYKLIAKSAFGLPWVTARNWWARLRGSFPVIILFHHLVCDRAHPLGMSTDQFVRQVEFLRKHYRIVSLEQGAALLRAGGAREPTVVLTFDDGYADNFLTLRAVAERTGVPLAFFVSTAHIGSGEPFAHDVHFQAPGFAPLSWEQVQRLAAEGFSIGAHTRTHFDCGTRDVEKLESEIAGAGRELTERLGKRCELFSFPFGLPANISREAMQIACAAYPLVLSAWGGSNVAPQNGVVQHLKRWCHPADLWELELVMHAMLEPEARADAERDLPQDRPRAEPARQNPAERPTLSAVK